MGDCRGVYFNVFTSTHNFGFDSLRSEWNAPFFSKPIRSLRNCDKLVMNPFVHLSHELTRSRGFLLVVILVRGKRRSNVRSGPPLPGLIRRTPFAFFLSRRAKRDSLLTARCCSENESKLPVKTRDATLLHRAVKSHWFRFDSIFNSKVAETF
jgi:hypothetical protein